MKFLSLSLFLMALTLASTVSCALAPRATPHAQLLRRKAASTFPDSIDVEALLADPKEYLHGVADRLESQSDANKRRHMVARWTSMTSQPEFASSLSHALAQQVGTQAAHVAMVQYERAAKKDDDEDDEDSCDDESDDKKVTKSSASATITSLPVVVSTSTIVPTSSATDNVNAAAAGSRLQQVANTLSSDAIALRTTATTVSMVVMPVMLLLLALL